MSAGDKRGWNSIHKKKSSLDNLPGQGKQLLPENQSPHTPRDTEQTRIKSSGFALTSSLSPSSPCPGEASEIHSHQNSAQYPDHCPSIQDLDYHILTVRPLEAISGRVRVAGVVSRFRALESCNITASISWKMTVHCWVGSQGQLSITCCKRL